MPEGDTIFRAARTLHRALAGNPVTSFESALPALNRIHDDAPITGRTIERVTAVGKHVLMHFSGNLVLRTHMRMNGSWHIYRPGERWQRSRRDMRIRIATEAFEAVGFNIPVAEFTSGLGLTRHRELRMLGPDVLSEGFQAAEAQRRIRDRGTTAIANVLLNQRVVAGLGNVYRSEAPVHLPHQSVHTRARSERHTPCRDRRNRSSCALRQRVRWARVDDDLQRVQANDRTRRSEGTAVGLRARGIAVPTVRDGDSCAEAGARRPAHVLVPEVSGVNP
jgi:formamidopyrimidine-DNA glycosylase